MTRLELTDAEAGMLREVLESYLSDLRMEIAHTDSQDFREVLKTRKAFLNELVGKLREETVAGR